MPVLLTAAVLYREYPGISVVNARSALLLVVALSVHAGSNLINTYFDYVNGVDRKGADDGTLVDGVLHPPSVKRLSGMCFMVACISIAVLSAMAGPRVLLFCVPGALLGYLYTGAPLALKYWGLGDLVIFLCFGPLLMSAASVALMQRLDVAVLHVSLIMGLLTDTILHANNARDAKADARAGAWTLAQTLGLRGSLVFLAAELLLAYVLALLLALRFGGGVVVILLSLPNALNLVSEFAQGQLAKLPQRLAQFNLLFGALLLGALVVLSS